MTYEEIITRYRKQPLIGECIDMIPINKDCLAEIVRLRNQERSVYYLNQGHKLTLQAQQEWFAGYLTRNNDLYWCIYDKNGTAIGTNRLYDVSEVCCTQGSFIIDENYSMGMPYALESMLLSLEFAFDCLGVKKIINEDRCDNAMMNSITKKFGFILTETVDIRGIKYNHYELVKENARLEKYRKVLEAFVRR